MTEKGTFNFWRVHDALRAVMREEGADYVYPPAEPGGSGSCYYNKPGVPQCIVGRALSRLVPDFKPPEGGTVVTFADQLRDLGFENDAILCLQMAQCMQDRGHTWGAAVEAAGHVWEILLYANMWRDGGGES